MMRNGVFWFTGGCAPETTCDRVTIFPPQTLPPLSSVLNISWTIENSPKRIVLNKRQKTLAA